MKGQHGGQEVAGGDAKEEDAEREEGEEEEEETDEQQQEGNEDEVTDRDCSICFGDMAVYDDDEEENEQEKTVTLRCAHRFHVGCVDLWKTRCASKGLTITCPMCRGTM